jgi:sigma-B regulation protein RsbQ
MPLEEDVLKTFNVNVFGNGTQAIVFAHGLGCDQSVWQYITPAFTATYKVILFDYIGSGKSNISCYHKERYSSLEGYANDLIDICTALNVKDVIFVGHSVSSMIGLLAAIRQPSLFSQLIMIGPSPYYLNEPPYMGGFDKEDIHQLLTLMKENYIQWSGFFAPKAMRNEDRPELSGTLKGLFCKADPDITYSFAKVTFLSDNRQDLYRLTVPSLILQPADDIVAPKHVGEYLHRNIQHSTLVYMEATGHFPHLSAVEETISLIKQYLKNALKE